MDASSRSGHVAVYVLDIEQPSMPTIVHSVLVSVSVFMALSTVFYSMNSSDNCPLSHSLQLMKVSFSPDVILCG